MNGKERFASAILILTLAIGIITHALDKHEMGDSGPGAAEECPRDSCFDSRSDFRRLDINTAGWEELTVLPGIGPKKARAIVEWRCENGRFADISQLTEVKGIGPKTLLRLQDYVCVGREETSACD
jgi:competence ComEA-like helix-hairpin-helix protein